MNARKNDPVQTGTIHRTAQERVPVEVVDVEGFYRFIGQPRKVVVWFFALWSCPSMLLGHRLRKIPAEILEKLPLKAYEFPTVSFDLDIHSKFRINDFPTLVLFDHGQETNRLVGLHSHEKVMSLLET